MRIIISFGIHIKETRRKTFRELPSELLNISKAKYEFQEHNDMAPVVTSHYSYIKNIQGTETSYVSSTVIWKLRHISCMHLREQSPRAFQNNSSTAVLNYK
jgi:hypothetical protein